MKKFLALLTALVLMLSAFASCSTPAEPTSEASTEEATTESTATTEEGAEEAASALSGDVALMVIDSFTGDSDAAIYGAADEFMSLNPDVNVTIEGVPATNIKEKFTTSAMSGAGPDIVSLDSSGWAVDAAAANLLMPLDEQLAPIADQFQEGPLNSGMFKGSYYAVPWYMNNMGMFYNIDILEEAGVDAPPATWDELTAALEKVSAIGKGGITFQYFLPAYTMYAFFFQSGNPVVDTSGDVPVSVLANESGTAAFNFLAELHTEYNAFPEAVKDTSSWDQVYAPFTQGDVAFLFVGDWANNTVAASGINYGIAPMPAGAEQATVLGGYTLSINKNTDNFDAAWAFVEYLTASEQNHILLDYGRMGARKDIDTAALIEQMPHLETFIEQNSITQARPAIIKSYEFEEMLGNAYKEVILGTKTAEEALADLDAAANDFLAKEYAS